MKGRNIEEQLADKFGNRSIAPTGQAWDRIAHNRQRVTGRKKKRAFLYYVAAAVACLISIGYFYVNLAEGRYIIAEPEVVNTGDDRPKKSVQHPVEVHDALHHVEGTAYKPKQLKIDTAGAVAKLEHPISVLQAEKIIQMEGIESIVPPIAQPRILTRESLNEEQATVLLDNAFKKMAAEKYLSTQTSDTALLKEVETEMDAYYREKAMKIFSLKHKVIRIAVKDQQ